LWKISHNYNFKMLHFLSFIQPSHSTHKHNRKIH
jgi:hypothetical protein